MNRETLTITRGQPITKELLQQIVDLGRGNPLPPGVREYDDGVMRTRRDDKLSKDAAMWFPCHSTANAPAFSLLKVYGTSLTEDGVILEIGLAPEGDDGQGVYVGNEEYELVGTPSQSKPGWVKLVNPSSAVRVAMTSVIDGTGAENPLRVPVKPDGLGLQGAVDENTAIAMIAQGTINDIPMAAIVSTFLTEGTGDSTSGDGAFCECIRRSTKRRGFQDDGFCDTYALTLGGMLPTPPIGSSRDGFEDCEAYTEALGALLSELNTQHDLVRVDDSLVWETAGFTTECTPVTAPASTTTGTSPSSTTTPSTGSTTTPPAGVEKITLTVVESTVTPNGLTAYDATLEFTATGGCCYSFAARRLNFNPARGNLFEVVDRHTNCLQFSWCNICVKPGSHGDYEPEPEDEFDNSDPVPGLDCDAPFVTVCDSYATDWYVVAGAQFIPPPPDSDSELRDGQVVKKTIRLPSLSGFNCSAFQHDGFANGGGDIAVTWVQEIFTPGSEGVETWWLRWKATLTLGAGSVDEHPVSLELSITTGVTILGVTDPPGFGSSGVTASYTGTWGCGDGHVKLTKTDETWYTISGNIAGGPHGTCPWQLPATVTAVPGDRIELYDPIEAIPEDRDGDCVPEYAECTGCGHPPTGTTGTTATTLSTSASLSTTTTGSTTTTTPPPTGACCIDAADGCGRICSEMTEAACLSSFGNPTYAGDGTDCMTHDCCNGYGSCCDESTGTCVDGVTEADCIALFGLNHTWSEGNNCAVMTCPV